MDNLIPQTRNAVRALIVRDGKILLQHKLGGHQPERYTLPGGAPEVGESLLQGVERECLEEIGAQVQVGDLVWVADFFKHRQTEPPTIRHQVEFLFECQVDPGYEAKNGPHPDRNQVDVLWVALDQLHAIPIFPPTMRTLLPRLLADRGHTYQGVME
ncbi:NUDIX domain-containing protein [Magnetococcus sp. PR-3]|uniref:NUDIX domain-containing protein n=1 Tax=Magnetococcus sp. PR-3 TaxID=3120355 RepID=UPI002FCDF1B3